MPDPILLLAFLSMFNLANGQIHPALIPVKLGDDVELDCSSKDGTSFIQWKMKKNESQPFTDIAPSVIKDIFLF
jgi:hypothetical protein